MVSKEPKKKPKFTGGKGQKRMKGKSLWNKKGITFFKTAEKNWRREYDIETMIQVLYQGWDLWLEVYRKNLKIGDGTNKTYFLEWQHGTTMRLMTGNWCREGRLEIQVKTRALTQMVVTIVIIVVQVGIGIGKI
jgi:hypothetical protein